MNSINSASTFLDPPFEESAFTSKSKEPPHIFPNVIYPHFKEDDPLSNLNSFEKSQLEIQRRTITPISEFIIPLENPDHQVIIKLLCPYIKKTEEGLLDLEWFSQLIAEQNQGFYYSVQDLKNFCETFSDSSIAISINQSPEKKKKHIQNQIADFKLWEKKYQSKNLQGKISNATKRALSPSVAPCPSSKSIRTTSSKWSETEDNWLREAVFLSTSSKEKSFGLWSRVSSELQRISLGACNKRSKQCRERYIEHLQPNTIQRVDPKHKPILMELCTLFYDPVLNHLYSTKMAEEINKKRPDQPQYTALIIKNLYHGKKSSKKNNNDFTICLLNPEEKQARIEFLINLLSNQNPEEIIDTLDQNSTTFENSELDDASIFKLDDSDYIWLANNEDFGLDLDDIS